MIFTDNSHAKDILNKNGDETHPCPTRRRIGISSDISAVARIAEV